jgi:hypothetical protein
MRSSIALSRVARAAGLAEDQTFDLRREVNPWNR